MSDIGKTLRKICAAFNAHDLDEIMTYLLTTACLNCREGQNPGVLGTKARRTCARDWQRASRGYPMCTTATSSISLMKTQTPACRNGY